MALGTARPQTDHNRQPATLPRPGRGPWRAARRHRRMPFVGLGGLLVIVCVLGYAYGTLRLGDRIEVLAVARPVAAGQVFTSADLTQVPAARQQAVRLLP